MQKRKLLALCVLASLAISPVVAQQPYPNKPIKLVVGFAAGGSADIAARLAAEKLTMELKQPVIVENRPGAGGNIGAEMVARAAPDGYTLLMASTSQIVINPSLYKKMSFSPIKDLVPVILVQNEHNLMVVTPSVPAKTLKEFIAYVKSAPTAVTFASPGQGTPAHLAGELMNQAAGLKTLHVPYKGTSAAVSDLLAGHVTMAIDNMPALLPQVKAGRLRALGVASEHRATAAPGIPTMDEAGLAGYVVPAWKGVMAPSGTPRPIIDKLNTAMNKMLVMPDVRQRMIDLGAEPAGGTPEKFGELIKVDIAKWAAVVKSTGTSLD